MQKMTAEISMITLCGVEGEEWVWKGLAYGPCYANHYKHFTEAR